MMIYETKKEAVANATGAEVVVKVCGGYMVMTASDYEVWRKQK